MTFAKTVLPAAPIALGLAAAGSGALRFLRAGRDRSFDYLKICGMVQMTHRSQAPICGGRFFPADMTFDAMKTFRLTATPSSNL